MTEKFIEKICRHGHVETNKAIYERCGNCILTYKKNLVYPLVSRVPERFRKEEVLI